MNKVLLIGLIALSACGANYQPTMQDQGIACGQYDPDSDILNLCDESGRELMGDEYHEAWLKTDEGIEWVKANPMDCRDGITEANQEMCPEDGVK